MAPANCVKELFEKISKNDLNAVKAILSCNTIDPETYDENGMTPLQHAAYRGNKEVVRLLLDQGANVNSGKHEYGYTALHFAALSGNTDVCQILLENGAKIHCTNSVGRTPAQMAAFVGNHSCVAVINNFVPKSEVEYFTVITGFEKEPKLPKHLTDPVYKFIIQINLSPVKIAINLQKSSAIYDNLDKVSKVLALMSEREMKRGFETNEVMSFKFHYLGFVLGGVAKCKKIDKSQEENEEEDDDDETKEKPKKMDPIHLFIKKMLKIKKGPLPEYQEKFLKDCVMAFPNRECTIFRQMVSTLSRCDSTSALAVIISGINGQRGFVDYDILTCATCNEEKVTKKCSKCKAVYYCDRECQRLHWFVHKKFCNELSKNAAKKEQTNDNDKESAVNAATEALVAEINAMKAK